MSIRQTSPRKGLLEVGKRFFLIIQKYYV